MDVPIGVLGTTLSGVSVVRDLVFQNFFVRLEDWTGEEAPGEQFERAIFCFKNPYAWLSDLFAFKSYKFLHFLEKGVVGITDPVAYWCALNRNYIEFSYGVARSALVRFEDLLCEEHQIAELRRIMIACDLAPQDDDFNLKLTGFHPEYYTEKKFMTGIYSQVELDYVNSKLDRSVMTALGYKLIQEVEDGV